MTQTKNISRRYRLVIVNHGEDASIQDTGSPEFGIRGRSCTVVRCQPVEAARAQCERMNAEWGAR